VIETATARGLSLTTLQLEQFARYADELRRWNEQVISEPQQIAVRHILDSLAV